MKLTEAEMRMVFQVESTNQNAALNKISCGRCENIQSGTKVLPDLTGEDFRAVFHDCSFFSAAFRASCFSRNSN